MSEYNVEIDLTAWQRMLNSFQRNGTRAVEILRAVFNTIGFSDIISHFEREEGPDGKWAKRAPTTQKLYAMIQEGRRSPPQGYPRAAFNPSNKILQLTGALRNSILPTNTKRISNEAILIFSNSTYGGKHDRGEAGMKKRPFMWFGQDALDKMAASSIQIYAEFNT